MTISCHNLRIPLGANEAQSARLVALQHLFASACNIISPIAQKNRCWNRVALHHLAYREVREKCPELGSQMACNAVYSVCRIYRMVYENPNSPFGLSIKEGGDLPLVKFLESNPVYFDRHTLSIKNQMLSMFTLDGRMHFQVNLHEVGLKRFQEEKLREITLVSHDHGHELIFTFTDPEVQNPKVIDLQWPNYILVNEQAQVNCLLEFDSFSQESLSAQRI
jgi:hypothetical protein